MQFSLLTFIKYANHNHNFDFEVCIMVRKNKSYQKKKKIRLAQALLCSVIYCLHCLFLVLAAAAITLWRQ